MNQPDPFLEFSKTLNEALKRLKRLLPLTGRESQAFAVPSVIRRYPDEPRPII